MTSSPPSVSPTPTGPRRSKGFMKDYTAEATAVSDESDSEPSTEVEQAVGQFFFYIRDSF
jgi:hypothetical protein